MALWKCVFSLGWTCIRRTLSYKIIIIKGVDFQPNVLPCGSRQRER